MSARTGESIDTVMARECLTRMFGFNPVNNTRASCIKVTGVWLQKLRHTDTYICFVEVTTESRPLTRSMIWFRGVIDDRLIREIAGSPERTWQNRIRETFKLRICEVFGIGETSHLQTRDFFSCEMGEVVPADEEPAFGLATRALSLPWNDPYFHYMEMIGLSLPGQFQTPRYFRFPPIVEYIAEPRIQTPLTRERIEEARRILAEGEMFQEWPIYQEVARNREAEERDLAQFTDPPQENGLIDLISVHNMAIPAMAQIFPERGNTNAEAAEPLEAERSQADIEKAFDALLSKKAEAKPKSWNSVFLKKK